MPAGTKPTPGQITKALGEIVRQRMEELDLRQPHLASRAGMSRSQIGEFLNGKKHIDVEQLIAICKAIDLDTLETFSQAMARDGQA